MAESVELATILLTDLVGSTRLATSVGPVRADELREEHASRALDLARAHGYVLIESLAAPIVSVQAAAGSSCFELKDPGSLCTQPRRVKHDNTVEAGN